MDFPIDVVRDAFPALSLTDKGRARVYLDNPAGTQVPRAVAEAAASCLLQTNANLGGFFVTSIEAEAIVERAHQAMAEFVGAASFREVVAGPSMTSLTFQFSRSLGRTFSRGDELVVTRMDHDGNISPWLALAEDLGLTVRWVPFDAQTWTIQPSELERALSPKTRIVALNYASNLTGSINDLRPLIDMAHAAGALTYVDAVQFAPHQPIDVLALDCDFLCCSSYKFFGPHLGILWGRETLLQDLYAYKVRPQTAALPWKFEVGTPQIEMLAALDSTVAYFDWLGSQCGANGTRRERILGAYAAAAHWERTLTARLVDGLQQFPGVTILGITDPARFDERVPTVSFVHKARSPIEIAKHLAQRNIFVWSGHNFALEIVRQLNVDEELGVIRIGMAHYNTPEEIDAALEALQEIL
ncbi:MAG TPA: cysteine desulfurase-like protein [Candidatus Baltobacteraceae bacterium]|jgi:cysteine desulfurase family protein (TIGR01976 family)|nr:cysteine desulfurase-like protein [Candidatus Baltobacteraceae bacterium]